MFYYEVLPADSRYRGGELTYSYEKELPLRSVVSVPLRARRVTAFVVKKVSKPDFAVKPVAAVNSASPLPAHCLELADWLAQYYGCSLGEALAQFAPSKPSVRRTNLTGAPHEVEGVGQIALDLPLTDEQSAVVTRISRSAETTHLLHGETGSGKTRVYLELAKKALRVNQSAILLTPEISLTAQLAKAVRQLGCPVFVFHSRLSVAARKKIWFEILECGQPAVVIGPRSALFSPLAAIGLIVLDEAHEPAYKQEQSPRYHAGRVASKLGQLTGAKVVLGTATPLAADYYLASRRGQVIRMAKPALPAAVIPQVEIIDVRDRSVFGSSRYLAKDLLTAISHELTAGRQAMVYLNRRGSARLILCSNCGWQHLCPNCDLPLIYHSDSFEVICHTCGYKARPAAACQQCKNPDIIYRGIGTKTLADELARLFTGAKLMRFDSDSQPGEHVNDLYDDLHGGKIDILVGTQLLAKGLDLPKLGLVGVIAAESSLALPDFSSEERSFQLLYQVLGRVGRGHGAGRAIVQTYQPDSPAVKMAASRDYDGFYKHLLRERQNFRFPPAVYLLKISGSRATAKGARVAAENLKKKVAGLKLPVEAIGPAPAFYGRRGRQYRWQLVIKSKDRGHLLTIAQNLPANWTADLDPINLL